MDTENPPEINSKPDQTSTGNQEIKSNFSSPLSSPTHEFSFTITLRQSPNSTPNTFRHSKVATPDLAPADDIFFHGHLLPLHRLPNPKTEHFGHFSSNNVISDSTNERKKSNSFSIRVGKWFEEKKKKKVFDIKSLLKRYTNMVEFFGKRKKKNNRELSKRPYSFSGNTNIGKIERERWMKRRGEVSAPVSMRTSPTNSGHLLATPTLLSSSRSSESSMEELQNAIQAAIAHCKNSGVKEKEM